MSDTAVRPRTGVDTSPSVVVDHVDVVYRVYADSQPKLRKAFIGDRKQREYRAVHAVRDVSFIAQPGQAVGIIGHNGSGKSTLLRAIAGLLPIDSGRVFARSLPVLLGVAAALEPDISARRNIYLGGTALGIPKAELEERLDEIIEFAGVEDFIDLPLRTFSTGMRSRLQFAIATAQTPEILMIDESLSVGDAEFKERSDDRIREMIGSAGTIFLVSHSTASILDVCDRVLWMDHGQLVGDGDPGEIVGAYAEHVKRLKAERKRKKKKS
jgi:teichoic acid transport system ATP-binding protein